MFDVNETAAGRDVIAGIRMFVQESMGIYEFIFFVFKFENYLLI